MSFEDDPIGNVTVSEIEPLYWILEDALFDGNKKRAISCFQLLAGIAKQKKSLLNEALHKRQIERLQEIAYELYAEETYVARKPIEIKSAVMWKEIPFKQEVELKEYLASHPEVLSEALEEKIRIVGVEVKTDFEFACDIVVESEKTFYPIELKIGSATHAVVSQIQKYCHFFYRKLRYNYFKPIQGIVISNGFCDWSVNELRKNGIRIFNICPKEKTIVLKEIQ